MIRNYSLDYPTTFVGRIDELTAISRLLGNPACRLLTLVGPGGIGKTRLALQAAADQTAFYPDGVYIVPLQSVTSTDLIPSAIASALKIIFYGTEEPRIQIINYLREKHLLLIIDNFEHLLDATDLLSEILAAALDVKILTTSRERLNLQEEWTLSVEGLPFPNDGTTDSLDNYSAVQLFVERARRVQSTFSLRENSDGVKAICQQVEGMPLGIELAASWLRVMTCQQIAAQMARSLAFLTTPLRNIPERHRSIRAVFEQSWNMLSVNEQAVLMRLSVFRGGFDLEASEAVAGASLITLASLADKSLIRLNAAGRYDLHELLRQYATDKLAEANETINTSNQHLLYFMKLAEDGEAHAYGSEQVAWYDRQEAEMDNLRAALIYSLSDGDIEMGFRMAAALRWVWEIRGHLNEGLTWIKELLPYREQITPSVRMKTLHRACEIAGNMRDHLQAYEWGAEALKLARAANDRWNIAWSLSAVAYFTEFSPYIDTTTRQTMLAESLALFRQLDDPFGLSHILRRSVHHALSGGDYRFTQLLLNEALSRDRAAGDKNAIAWELLLLGEILSGQHQKPAQIIATYRESISLFMEARDMQGASWVLGSLADFERSRGNKDEALAAYRESILLLRRLGLYDAAAFPVSAVGTLIAAKGELAHGVSIMGAAYARLRKNNNQPSDMDDRDLAILRIKLGEEAFAQAVAEGEAMTWERAVTYALGEEPLPIEIKANQSIAQPLIEPLTDRELEILRLMVQGLSNPQIAERLIVATGTIKAHTNSIFGKLGVNNRVQAVNRAKELHLLDK